MTRQRPKLFSMNIEELVHLTVIRPTNYPDRDMLFYSTCDGEYSVYQYFYRTSPELPSKRTWALMVMDCLLEESVRLRKYEQR